MLIALQRWHFYHLRQSSSTSLTYLFSYFVVGVDSENGLHAPKFQLCVAKHAENIYERTSVRCCQVFNYCAGHCYSMPFHGVGPQFTENKYIFYLSVSAVLATAKCPAGWLSHCIKTAKPIWKLFWPSESPIILVFWDPCADTQFQFSGGVKYMGGGKIGNFCAIFNGYLRLSRKQCKIGRWLLWNVNRKSWVLDWMV